MLDKSDEFGVCNELKSGEIIGVEWCFLRQFFKNNFPSFVALIFKSVYKKTSLHNCWKVLCLQRFYAPPLVGRKIDIFRSNDYFFLCYPMIVKSESQTFDTRTRTPSVYTLRNPHERRITMAKKIFTNAQEARITEIVVNAVAQAFAQYMPPKGKGDNEPETVPNPAPAPAPKRTPEEKLAAFEHMKAEWAEKRANYKPSKKLIDAIKGKQEIITHAVARDKYAFVGTKKDLDALKAKHRK